MKSILRILPLLVLLSLSWLMGCTSDESTNPTEPSTALEFIDQGWSEYHAGQYTDGEVAFEQALNRADEDLSAALDLNDPDLIAAAVNVFKLAANGLGWCAIKADDPSAAASTFPWAIFVSEEFQALDAIYADAIGGYAVFLQLDGQLQQSNTWIATLLAFDSNWSFSQDATIDYLDLRLIRTENYFALGEYDFARTEVMGFYPDIPPGMALPFTQAEVALFNLATIEDRGNLIEMIEALDKIF